jgi:Polyketide cyclase / dehydrase and lipid transport
MAKVYVSAVLDAPTARVWQKIRDFNGLAGWVPAISASEIIGGGARDQVGSVRALSLANDGGTVKERLLALDDFHLSYSYSIIESPLPIANYVAHIRLKPVTSGDRTFVEWAGEFDVLSGDPEDLRKLFAEGVYGAGLARLAELLAIPA